MKLDIKANLALKEIRFYLKNWVKRNYLFDRQTDRHTCNYKSRSVYLIDKTVSKWSY